MASNGIAGRVAVVAMGCSHFGERFDTSTEDLILEARELAQSMYARDPDDRGMATLAGQFTGSDRIDYLDKA